MFGTYRDTMRQGVATHSVNAEYYEAVCSEVTWSRPSFYMLQIYWWWAFTLQYCFTILFTSHK
jgi:hypothetical protein